MHIWCGLLSRLALLGWLAVRLEGGGYNLQIAFAPEIVGICTPAQENLPKAMRTLGEARGFQYRTLNEAQP